MVNLILSFYTNSRKAGRNSENHRSLQICSLKYILCPCLAGLEHAALERLRAGARLVLDLDVAGGVLQGEVEDEADAVPPRRRVVALRALPRYRRRNFGVAGLLSAYWMRLFIG